MTHYQALGLQHTATPEQIGAAFRKRARKCHPDINKRPGAEADFKRINEAYQVLSDPTRRKEYDTSLDAPPTIKEQSVVDKLINDPKVREAAAKVVTTIFEKLIKG